MKTVGILGGSFNPITIGHIKLCQYVLDNHSLDEIWLMPCYGHRFKSSGISPEDRLEMCKIARKNHEKIKVSDFEIVHQLDGSTHETSILLEINYPLYKFKFIVGMDNANSIDSWKESEQLKKYVPFVVVSRQGIEEQKDKWYHSGIHTFLCAGKDIPETSSTECRAILNKYNEKDGSLRLDELLFSDVKDYILKKGLYVKKDL